MSDPSNQAKAIFLAALEDHAPEQWSAFLHRACAGDKQLQAEVEKLLHARGRMGSFHETPRSPLPPTLDEPRRETLGSVIGRYKLVQMIGEGGMGTVYMAQQTEPVNRLVALKLIKPGMDSRQVIARFEAERQALALMDHPNIAKVLDAGATATGLPYFVMELVKGVPLTKYCDEHRLTPNQRLDLFIPVCQAIQHAHQKGIIHRDIKPSNVLVAPYDGKPVAKVIDFGVAKATGQQLTERTLVTGLGTIVGTLEYMSPEQAELNQFDIDTRSDIYSLGVLLYELLTGTTPLERKRLKVVAALEVLRLIREEEPPKPSTRLSESKGSLASISAQRRMEPTKLTRQIHGELDWIVMKALEKDRNRRYETANGFAQDVQRYLTDQPVHACPPSALYRFRKFARRNKARLLIVAGALVLLLVLAVGIPVNAVLRQERDIAVANLERAERAEQEAAVQSGLARARAFRWSGQVGQRLKGLEALADAARRGPSAGSHLELRNEVIACLTLADLRLVNARTCYLRNSMPLAFDAAFEHYANTDGQGNISVRRLADDAEISRLPGPGPGMHAYFAKFSPDGRFLAAVYHQDAKGLRVWDWRQCQIAWTRPLFGSMDFSPDSRQVVLHPREGGIGFYAIATGREERMLPSGTTGQHYFAFDPAGRRLAVADKSRPQIVQIYDLDSAAVCMTLRSPLAQQLRAPLGWSPDGQWLATAVNDLEIHVWNASTGKAQAVLRGHESRPTHVAFNRRGDLLASTGWDGTLRLWDPMTGRQLLSRDGGVLAQFSQDGRLLPCANGKWLELFEVIPPGVTCRVLADPLTVKGVESTCFSPDGRLFSSAGAGGVGFWDTATWQSLTPLYSAGKHAAVFHPDGGSLVTCGDDGLYHWPIRKSPSAAPRDLQIGPPQRLGTATPVIRACYSADGRTLAVAERGNGQVVVFSPEAPSGKALAPPYPQVYHVAVSPDGRWVAAGKYWGLVTPPRIWDLRNGQLVVDLPRGAVPSDATVTFSPDGLWLVTATGQEFRFWQVGSWQPGRVIPRSFGGSLRAGFAFSRDGRVLALTESLRLVKLIDAATGLELASLATPDGQGGAHLTFSPDGSQLAACCDGEIHLWDLRHLRRELAGLGLDWNLPPYPPVRDERAGPLQVHVDYGEFASPDPAAAKPAGKKSPPK